MLPGSPSIERRERSGHDKRRQRNAWPKPMWVYSESSDRSVLGAALFCSARKITHDDTQAEVEFCRAVTLVRPLRITDDNRRYKSSVFALVTGTDLALRQNEVAVGGLVCNHFAEHVLEPCWKVFCLCDTSAFHTSSQDPARMMKIVVPTSMVRLCGQILLQPLPVPPADSRPVLDCDGEDSEPGNEPAPSLVPLVAPRTEADTEHFALALDDLAIARGGGAVLHTFKPRAILNALIFNTHLKPNTNMKDALADGVRLMLGSGGSALAQKIQAGEYTLPSVGVLRAARQRLDICRIVFQQQAWLQLRVVFFQSIDSSPQMGYNILACIHDVVVVPEPRSVAITGVLLSLKDYTSYICPLSSLARGHATLIVKARKAVNILLMHSGDENDFDRKRRQFRGNTSDQGTEAGVGDMSVSIVKNYSKKIPPTSADSFLYPNLLSIPGFLHILYDALEKPCAGIP
jgi:hypothetical protein